MAVVAIALLVTTWATSDLQVNRTDKPVLNKTDFMAAGDPLEALLFTSVPQQAQAVEVMALELIEAGERDRQAWQTSIGEVYQSLPSEVYAIGIGEFPGKLVNPKPPAIEEHHPGFFGYQARELGIHGELGAPWMGGLFQDCSTYDAEHYLGQDYFNLSAKDGYTGWMSTSYAANNTFIITYTQPLVVDGETVGTINIDLNAEEVGKLSENAAIAGATYLATITYNDDIAGVLHSRFGLQAGGPDNTLTPEPSVSEAVNDAWEAFLLAPKEDADVIGDRYLYRRYGDSIVAIYQI